MQIQIDPADLQADQPVCPAARFTHDLSPADLSRVAIHNSIFGSKLTRDEVLAAWLYLRRGGNPAVVAAFAEAYMDRIDSIGRDLTRLAQPMSAIRPLRTTRRAPAAKEI